MNSLQNIELVIFDCDGVLVDTELLANRVFIEEITKFGFSLTAEEAWEHFPGSRFQTCVEYVEKSNHKKVPLEFLDIYRKKSAEVFAAEVQAIPGIGSVLDSLKLPKAVASNGPMTAITGNLSSAGLLHYFHPDHLFSAYTFQKWKPEPDMHLHVSKTFGIPPSKCLVIEDSVPGIAAAVSAGMQVIGFTHEHRNQKIKPLEIPQIDQYDQLLEMIPHAFGITKSLFSL